MATFSPLFQDTSGKNLWHLLLSVKAVQAAATLPSLWLTQTDYHALILSRLDYGNVVYTQLPKTALQCLQLIQNNAARTISGRKQRDHITPALIALHWLPVAQRVRFKLAELTHHAFYNQSPTYLTSRVHRVTWPRCLHSSSSLQLVVLRMRLVSKGDRAISVAGPRIWNQLPVTMQAPTDHQTFRKALKTWLFGEAFLAHSTSSL